MWGISDRRPPTDTDDRKKTGRQRRPPTDLLSSPLLCSCYLSLSNHLSPALGCWKLVDKPKHICHTSIFPIRVIYTILVSPTDPKTRTFGPCSALTCLRRWSAAVYEMIKTGVTSHTSPPIDGRRRGGSELLLADYWRADVGPQSLEQCKQHQKCGFDTLSFLFLFLRR